MITAPTYENEQQIQLFDDPIEMSLATRYSLGRLGKVMPR
jgi:hypothetical protein